MKITDAGASINEKRDNELAYVRPIIAISVNTSKAAIERSIFHYYFCPFCGTKSYLFNQPCPCCNLSLRAYYSVQHGYTGGGIGCLIAFCVVLLLLLGGLAT